MLYLHWWGPHASVQGTYSHSQEGWDCSGGACHRKHFWWGIPDSQSWPVGQDFTPVRTTCFICRWNWGHHTLTTSWASTSIDRRHLGWGPLLCCCQLDPEFRPAAGYVGVCLHGSEPYRSGWAIKSKISYRLSVVCFLFNSQDANRICIT